MTPQPRIEEWSEMMRKISGVLWWSVVLAPMLTAQDLAYRLDGEASGDFFGLALSGIGDTDGDGRPDILVGAFQHDGPGAADRGRVSLFSGRDGARRWSVDGEAAGDLFGWAASSAGDVDGDGCPDVVVGAYRHASNAGTVSVFSGCDAHLLHRVPGASGDYLGWAVDGVGDVNGDGFADFAAAAHDHDTVARADFVRVFSGKDASVLFTFAGEFAGHTLGVAIAGVGDASGDGVPDLLVGAAFDDRVATDAGSARVYSLATGSVLHEFLGNAADDRFGINVASAGDVNGDGLSDLVIGANGADDAANDAGRATVFAGGDGHVLFAIDGRAKGDNLGDVGGAGDVNGDGFADVLAGAPSADGRGGVDCGTTLLVSGRNGRVLYEFSGNVARDAFGRWVRGVGDVDGDGRPDLAIGAPLADQGGANAGAVFVLRGNDLFLQADRKSYAPGDLLSLATRGGPPGALAAQFLVTLNGVPMWLWLATTALDLNGESTLSAVVPPGLSGQDAELIAFAVAGGGPVLASNLAVISFQ